MTRKPTTIAEYIQAAPLAGQPHLRRLYAVLKKVAPKAHLNFSPMAAGLEPFGKELEKHKTTKGMLQVPYNQPLPEDLIRRIAARRLRDVRERKDESFW